MYYKKYCTILSSITVSAHKKKKKKYFDGLILESSNKSKTTWNTVKTIVNKKSTSGNPAAMNINNTLDSNPRNTANAFNTYFTNIAGNLVKNISRKGTTMNKNPLHYLHQNTKKQNSPIKLDYTTTHEINNKIIHSLKSKDSYG